MKRKIRWPAVKVLRKWYEAGVSTTEIGRRVGVNANVVNYHLRVVGIQIRSIKKAQTHRLRSKMKRQDLLSKSSLRRLYTDKKWTTSRIARRVGCSRDTVVRAIRHHGILIRYATRISDGHWKLYLSLKRLLGVQREQVDYRPLPWRYNIDIAFPGVKLAVEVDGYFHFDADRQKADRIRQLNLERDGWTFLRISAVEAQRHPAKYARRVIDLRRKLQERKARRKTT